MNSNAIQDPSNSPELQDADINFYQELNYKDKRIKQLDYEVMLLGEIVDYLLRGNDDMEEKLKKFYAIRQDNSAQRIIEQLRIQKQVLLNKVIELIERLREYESDKP